MKTLLFFFVVLHTIGAHGGSWPSGMNAAVSFTYDDGYVDNIDVAAPALEKYGYRGTFYLTKDVVVSEGARTGRGMYAEWAGVYRNGHEIGSHGARHTCTGVTGDINNPDTVTVEVANSRLWLNAAIARDDMRSYAYPCGETVAHDEQWAVSETYYPDRVGEVYHVARTGNPGINRTSDLLEHRTKLKAYPITPANASVAYVADILEQAEQEGEWVIFVFHSIGTGVLAISPELHEAILSHTYYRGVFWVAPVRDVAAWGLWHRQAED